MRFLGNLFVIFSRIIHKLRELLWFPSWISPESIELQWILWDFNQTTYATSYLKGYTGRSWECRFRARKNAADRPHLLDQPAVSLLPTTASLQQHGRCLGNQEFWECVIFHGNLGVTPPKPTPSLESTALIRPNWLNNPLRRPHLEGGGGTWIPMTSSRITYSPIAYC